MTAASKLMIEKGAMRLSSELLVARVHEVEIDADHVTRPMDQSSHHSEEREAPKPPPSWLVVEFLSDTTEFTATRVEDGSWRYRLQLDKADANARARLVRQVLGKRWLKIVRGNDDHCGCEWPDR